MTPRSASGCRNRSGSKFVIDNRAGAGSRLGIEVAAKSIALGDYSAASRRSSPPWPGSPLSSNSAARESPL